MSINNNKFISRIKKKLINTIGLVFIFLRKNKKCGIKHFSLIHYEQRIKNLFYDEPF